ncbi:hypothetical protein P7C70_g5071, partial [Phenoliferia sp. Uapishka_3]
MSRHRIIKNMNLDDELDDDAMDDSDEGAAEAKLESAMTAVHLKLGPTSPITDKDIKDALWNYYFDVDESISYLKDEQRKKDKAAGDAIPPPTLLLQTLSLDPTLNPSSTTPLPAKQKLAAKIAAAKAAKLAASSPAPPQIHSAPPPSTTSIPASSSTSSSSKPLSKLQLKQLAAQAARKGLPSTSSA